MGGLQVVVQLCIDVVVLVQVAEVGGVVAVSPSFRSFDIDAR